LQGYIFSRADTRANTAAIALVVHPKVAVHFGNLATGELPPLILGARKHHTIPDSREGSSSCAQVL
jgi:hypothetical protein